MFTFCINASACVPEGLPTLTEVPVSSSWPPLCLSVGISPVDLVYTSGSVDICQWLERLGCRPHKSPELALGRRNRGGAKAQGSLAVHVGPSSLNHLVLIEHRKLNNHPIEAYDGGAGVIRHFQV